MICQTSFINLTMPTKLKPALPLPDPLRGIEVPSFTNYSIVVRLPEIAQRTLAENDFPAEVVTQIKTLITEIPDGKIRPVHVPLAPDAARWEAYIAPHLGQNWLEVPWFFAEEYFYERMLEACGYFQPGPRQGMDPYARQKRLGLETTRGEIHTLCEHVAEILQASLAKADLRKALDQLLVVNLWGNQKDLSLWPASEAGDSKEAAGSSSRAELNAAREHLLIDATPQVLRYLDRLRSEASSFDFLIDNAGYELVADLALADVVLSSQLAAEVFFHVKVQPVFVSDAMEKDVLDTLDFLSREEHAEAQALAKRMREHHEQGRFHLRADPFWTSPLAMWEMPDPLYNELSGTNLLISKGDANYRRLLGDRHWSLDASFERILSYLPFPVLSLRTCKSEIAVGLNPLDVPQSDPDWLIDGRWGLIQFSPE